MLTFSQTVILCILLHIIADFNLQGMFCNLKQKSWWEKEVLNVIGRELKDTRYRYDYMAALFLHSLSWSILTFIPFLFHPWFAYAVAMNTLFHMGIDHLKANMFRLNLIEYQLLHFGQILLTVFVLT